MRSITYTNARQNFAKTIESVYESQTPILITKKDVSVVMLSLEDYEALEETSYLLRSPKNMFRLAESINQIKERQGFEEELVE